MLQNEDFHNILEELIDFCISRYKENFSTRYQDTDLVLYQKYTYEDACRLLNWERNEVPLNIGGYKYDKKTKTFPVFINYDKQDNISDTTKYEDHFTSYNRLIAISKSGRSIESEDVQNFLNAKERGIDVQLFVRKNKDDKISKPSLKIEKHLLLRKSSMGIADSCFMTRKENRLWQCIGNTDSTIWSKGTTIFTESKCQTSRLTYADIPTVAIKPKRA